MANRSVQAAVDTPVVSKYDRPMAGVLGLLVAVACALVVRHEYASDPFAAGVFALAGYEFAITGAWDLFQWARS